MVDDALNKFFSVAAGVWAIFLMNAVAIFKYGPNFMGRLNERRRDAAAEKAEDWHRLRAERDRKDAELANKDIQIANRDRLLADSDDEKDELRRANIALEGRAVKAEATLQGYAEARQKLAVEEAAKRIVEDAKKNGNSP